MMLRRLMAAILGLVAFGAAAVAQPPATGRVAPTENEFQSMSVNAGPRHAEITADWQPATEQKWDSREHGWVPRPKNQRSCGSCWAFSGHGCVEIAYCRAGLAKPTDFDTSEQYTLSCCENGGCSGDDNTTVLKHAKRVGLPLTKDYGPYRAQEQRCAYKDSMKRWPIDDWAFADGAAGYEKVGKTQKIKDAIKNAGGVGCAVAADNSFSNHRAGTVFHGSGSRQINHDVMLVGWDDSLVSGKTVWIMRNSWGTEWCDGGYMLIVEGANQIGTEPVYAVMKVTPPEPAPHVHGARHVVLWVAFVVLAGGLVVLVVVLVKRKKVAP